MKRHNFLDNNKRKTFSSYELNAVLFKYLKISNNITSSTLNKKIMYQSYYRLQKLQLYKSKGLNLCTISGRARSTYLHSISRHKFLEYQAQGLIFG